MVLSQSDKVLLSGSIRTELARIERAAKAASIQAIKDILVGQIDDLRVLEGRIFNEPAKEVK